MSYESKNTESFWDDIEKEVQLRNSWLNFQHRNIKLPSYCYWHYSSILKETNNQRIYYWQAIKTNKKFQDWNQRFFIQQLLSDLSK